jgi:cobalt-zinc-cadmium efflux system membrane fusion protein
MTPQPDRYVGRNTAAAAHTARPAALALAVALAWVPGGVRGQPLDCLIQPNQVVQVGSPVSGILEGVDVERGDTVRRGQVVARLESSVERATAQLAQARATQTAELQAAERSRAFARREMARARDLVDENFVSKAAADKAETESQVSEHRLQQAVERRQQAEQELKLAEAQLARRQVRAPIGGIVVDRFAAAGEYVDDRPILRIAEVNPLRVEVVVPAAAFGLVAQGARAVVRPEAGPVRDATATVTIVDRVLDPASNTFRVRLSLPNPDARIPAGSRCKVDFGADLQTRGGAPGSAPPSGSVPAAAPRGVPGGLPAAVPPLPAPRPNGPAPRVDAPAALAATGAPPPARR